MTKLSELIDIPEQVHKSDFVISLTTAVEEPERTVADYVVTPQLASCSTGLCRWWRRRWPMAGRSRPTFTPASVPVRRR